MSKVPPTLQVPLAPHVKAALEDVREDASIVERAAVAWGAEHQSLADRAMVTLLTNVKKAFGVELEVFNSEWFDRGDPRECAGGTYEGLIFGYRNAKLSVILPCAEKDCAQELHGPVNGYVELGRVLSLIEDEKVDGVWRCPQHKKKAS